jgi:alpha-amylase
MLSTGKEPACTTLKDYCGGTFRDLIQLLDYIKALGFDAIYISPFVENTPGGYHGYWAKNFYRVNPEFGSEADLKELVREAHKMEIKVMVDVVFNHIGYVENNDFSDIVPFNSEKYYHDDC